MRRVLALLLMGTIAGTLAGCRAGKTTAEPVGDRFTCRVEAAYQSMKVAGKLTRRAAGTLELAFSEPDSLAGVTALWDGETVRLELEGMSFSVDPATVPESALGEELIAVLDAAARGDGSRTQEDGRLVVRGTGSNGDYVLTCDPETGVPQTLSVPGIPLTVTFSELQQTE